MMTLLLALQTAGPEAEPAAAVAHEGPSEILMHHVLDQHLAHVVIGPFDLGPTKHLLFFMAVGILLLALMRWALASYRGGIPRSATRWRRRTSGTGRDASSLPCS